MARKERTRMYCHPDFKKMIEIKRIEIGEKDSVSFTKRVANNPDLLKRFKDDEKPQKKFKTPKLF